MNRPTTVVYIAAAHYNVWNHRVAAQDVRDWVRNTSTEVITTNPNWQEQVTWLQIALYNRSLVDYELIAAELSKRDIRRLIRP